MIRVFKFLIFIAVLIFTAIFISTATRRLSDNSINHESKISVPTGEQKISTTSENIVKITPKKPILKTSESIALNHAKNIIPVGVREVSSKSFEELINSSVIQLYCGNLNADETSFSGISRGTGVIVSSDGKILTNRHVVYNENANKIKDDCFILKSPFPNVESQKPKIYYIAEIINYPLIEKFSDSFSKDKYYNDFAILKINTKINKESKINLFLGFDYASENDYLILEDHGIFNFLPIDWNYQPKDDDALITLGYGVDASHLANQITSTVGKISGNININKSAEPQILLIESNATSGFSGGALINPKSKGLVGLVSWITAGDIAGKYTVAIFRDFLRSLMLADLNFDLKLIQNP